MASGMSGLPASARAAATSCAVRVAVPDGASALRGWCSSTISTDSKCGAAAAAKRIISTAAIPKFGAITAPVPGEASSQARTWSNLAASKPVVPTTGWIPAPIRNSRLPITDSGCVKSTATWAPAATSSWRSSPTSRLATSSRSGAS